MNETHAYLDQQLSDAKKQGFMQYRTSELPTWCPGCGYFGIMHAIVQTCHSLKLKYEDICVVSGIGCAGRYPIFMNAYGFHTLHGRALPVSTGIKLAREDLTVFTISGDGDALGIGGGHLPHAARKNIDITMFLFDNAIYGLTKGQSSPTTPQGQLTGSHPAGNPDFPLKPVNLALSYGATFVARVYAGDVEGMKRVFAEAVSHNGFSFLHILSPCVTFDKVNLTWKRMRDLFIDVPPTHDPADYAASLRLAQDERPVLGIFFQDKTRLSYQDYLKAVHKAG